MANRVMGGGDWGLLILLALLWGFSFFFVEIAVRDLPPLTVVLSRVALAAAALLLVMRAIGEGMPRSARIWGAFTVMGFVNNLVPFSLIFWAQTEIESGLAAILNATTPLWAVFLAHLLTADERMTANRVAGVLIGLVGVVTMIGPAALAGIGAGVIAQAAVLGAAICYALAGIFGRRFGRLGVTPLATATGQVTMTTLIALPLVMAVDRPWTLDAPGGEAVAALVALALLGTAAAYVIYFRILARAGATNILLVTLLVPVSAVLLGTFLLGEALEPRHFLGMVAIALGLGCIDGRPLLWLRGARARA